RDFHVTGVQTCALPIYAHKDFDVPLRRIRYKDPGTAKTLVFLTHNFALPALTITELYRCRWQVELFFKWIKQHLRFKAFFGTTEIGRASCRERAYKKKG